KSKPYRWICLRWIPPDELIAAHCRCERFRNNHERQFFGNANGKKNKGNKGKGKRLLSKNSEITWTHDRSTSASSTSNDVRNRQPRVNHEELTEGSKNGVWHRVTHDISDRRVVTSHFATNMNIDIVQSVIEEKFDLLDEGDDDPEIFRAALQDSSFVELLKLYFESGDQENPRLFHTLAQMQLRQYAGQTLLHFCCENGFTECVRFLIENHAAWITNAE
ncbi:unnamed protein product, partial [Amoebophrya sp. A25]